MSELKDRVENMQKPTNCMKEGFDIYDEFSKALYLIKDQQARINELESRLEIQGQEEGFPDGITCRNHTIGLLEGRIEELEARESIRAQLYVDAYIAVNELDYGNNTHRKMALDFLEARYNSETKAALNIKDDNNAI